MAKASPVTRVMVLFTVGMLPPGAGAGTIGVTSTTITAEDDGTCTLVEAIHSANNDSASGSSPGECPPGDGYDVIVLQAGARYELTTIDNSSNGDNGLPTITSDIAIQGNGAVVERLANAPSMRIFDVEGTGALALANLTIRGGNQPSGSAIHSQGGPLEMTHTRVEQNIGDAVHLYDAPLTMDEATVSSSAGGGGIRAQLGGHSVQIERSEIMANGSTGLFVDGGDVTITDSTVSQNLGAGVWLRGGTFAITNSTFAQNATTGLWLDQYDGDGASGVLSGSAVHGNAGRGVYVFLAGPTTIVNSTIAANGSGIEIEGSGAIDILNTTIAGNQHDGLVNYSTQTNLKNTLIANQQSGADCLEPLPQPPWVITSLGHNLDSDGTCGLIEPSDLPGLDPLLDEPAFNCGATKNCALSAGSPAVDVADTAVCIADPVGGIDQRGLPRPSDGDHDESPVCDIGAFELHLPDYDEDGIPEDGDGSCTAGDGRCAAGQTTDCDDNCATVWNPGQEDEDEDAVGTACDSCPAVFNPSQSDWDVDGVGDHCDLDDGLVYLSLSRWDLVEWQAELGVDACNLYRGDLDVLKATGVYTQEPGSNPLADRLCGIATPYATDPYLPPSGKTAFYLLGPLVEGVEGSLGRDSEGIERPNDEPCPET